MMATTSINIGVEIYKKNPVKRKSPIVLHAQIIKVFLIACAILTIISTILGVSISALFASIGAVAAIFAFVFKDIVGGLIASLQVTYQDIIRVGDWIKLPKHDIEGEVEKITINIIVVKNFDSTTSTFPTSILTNDLIINHRLLFENNCRRIKRSINIDMNFVKIADQNIFDNINNTSYMQNFALQNRELININSGVSNLALLRKYINFYLVNNDDIHKDSYWCLTRYLQPNSTGIPLEIFAFAKKADLVPYEEVQSNIIEHLLSVLPIFELRAFQAITSIILKE